MPKSKGRGKQRPNCLHDKNVVYARGLCWGCFQKHRVAIESNQITDDEAVDRGLIFPKERRGPKKSGKGYETALAKSKK